MINIENGQPMLKDFQRRELIAGYAEACGLPEAFFSADFNQLDPTWRPGTQDRIAHFEGITERLTRRIESLARESNMERTADRHGIATRLDSIERKLSRLDEQRTAILRLGREISNLKNSCHPAGTSQQ